MLKWFMFGETWNGEKLIEHGMAWLGVWIKEHWHGCSDLYFLVYHLVFWTECDVYDDTLAYEAGIYGVGFMNSITNIAES
jgi:hypothetical protein